LIYEDQAKSFLFKRRPYTRENRESCNAALFRSVSHRKEKQAIVKLKNKEGVILTKTDEIM